MALKMRDTKTSSTSANLSAQITDEIAKLAYQYFLDRNCAEGHDFDDWLRAERVIKAKYRIR